jgi:hypothetical protein
MEFLGERGVRFEALNIGDRAAGERRWREAGRPLVPSLVVGEKVVPVLHVSQIAEALGLSPPPSGHPLRDGRDAAIVLGAWLSDLEIADWDLLLTPSRSRGRSLRNLTVNVFHPFELLPAAWTTGEFDWQPEQDDARETHLTNHSSLVRFAEPAATAWSRFLDEHGREIETHDPLVSSPRGRVPFSALLSFQRWHVAYHYRQLAATLEVEPTILDRLDDLELPAEVF